jgi:2'-5' RNA ligase
MRDAETMRSFVALDLPEEAKDSLFAFVEKKRKLYPGAKWVKREHLHVTLSFFPALPVTAVAKIQDIMVYIASSFSPYYAILKEVGTFPSWQRARVLWMGFDEKGRVYTGEIAKVLFEGLKREGIEAEEERDFVPHITLARFRSPMPLRDSAFSEWSPLPARIEKLVLFKSTLTPSGPIYEEIVSVLLKG